MNKTGPRNFLGPVCFFLLSLAAPLSVDAAPSIQEVLLRAKPAVAIVVVELGADVTVDCGAGRTVTVPATPLRESGTGWFVASSGWLVTSGHVVALVREPSAQDEATLRASGVQAACGDGRTARNARTAIKPSISVILPSGKRLSARVEKYSAPVGSAAMSGRDLALLQVDAKDLPMLPMGDSTRVKIGDRVHVFGFPTVVMSHELLNSAARVDASITSGTISGFKEDVNGQPVLQTDASAAGGDTGGPAVNDRGEVVGVLTFVSTGRDQNVVQGFNFIIPTNAVRDFVAGTGVALSESGGFNRAWGSAVGAFFAGDYVTAKRHLADAERLLPDVPDVRRLAVETEERITNPPPRPFPWRIVGAGLALAGGAGCASIWVLWWKRNRFRVRPQDIAPLLENADSTPVLLDVRDEETYNRSPVQIAGAVHLPANKLAAGESELAVERTRPVVAYCT